MSYRGRPSKGCESCRSRKVKCDEAKPVCSRCSKSDHECKYRDQGDLLFRNQTANAAQRAEDSWRKRAKSHQRSTSPSSASHQSSPPSTHESLLNDYQRPPPQSGSSSEASSQYNPILDNLSLGQKIQPDLQRLAYERFVYDFVVFDNPNHDLDASSSALWDFIPPLYHDAAEGSSLKTIIHAVAYANFSARCNAPQVQILAEENFAKGFKLLRKMLSDKKKAASDHALCSVYLLGVWENLTTPSHNGHFLAHKEGADALIQLRTMEEVYSNSVSARLYDVSYAQMLLGSMFHAKAPNLPTRDPSIVRKLSPTLYSTSGIYIIQLIHKVVTVHANWHDIKSKHNPALSRQYLGEILKTALDLDSEFQSWEATIPSAWRYQIERNTPEARSTHEPKWRDLFLRSRGAPEEIHSYATLKNCTIWMFYRTSRLFLLRDSVEILNWMFKLPESTSNASPLDFDSQSKTPQSLDNVTLSIHHAFATSHLVATLEKSCSAILGSYTVPIYGKSNDDVAGMRGYGSIWSLGVMDSMLRSGLIPDTGAPPMSSSSSAVNHDLFGPSSFSQFRNQPAPSPSVFKLPSQNIHPLYHNPATAVPNSQDFPKLPGMSHQPSLGSYVTSTETPSCAGSLPPIDPRPLRRHPFDGRAPHPNDAPTKVPVLDFSITKSSRIDIAARREWINKILYYVGTRLGIKKGLSVVFAEGYMEISKREVDRIFGN